ncbi:MAG: RDD family protein [Lentisphaeria bacterium]|nr:RDD family protein [Lentisphaeria bacterium]
MEKAYIVSLENGEQLGPLDEEALRRLAEAGTITENAQIRSTMLAIWSKAKDTDCLKKIFREQMLQRAEQFANDPKAQLKARLEMRGDFDPLANALSQEGVTYHDCSFFVRLLAGLTDLLILLVVALGILFFCWLASHSLGPTKALTLFCVVTWFVAALYYMYFLAKFGQTLGQRFWGLVVITPDRGCVYPIKGFLFFIFTFFFGLISPLTWLIFGCRSTLQEWIPKVLVKHISVARSIY